MSSIQKLPPEVASRIAAGEVAERPFNVVKELMENSVDAGATQITVEIADGGLSLIRITDNGKGIDETDLPLALERFATSKARSVEDVYSASTFGFRGEALAAISSVSDFTLTSGTSADTAFEIKSRFGIVGEVKPASSLKGTVIEVINLFENVPARRKFLKGTRSLETEIIKFIKHFSLINPCIEISAYSNSKLVYEVHSNEDICIRAAKVFSGKGFYKGVLEYGSSKITVAATLPETSDRLKRDGIIIGVNGRLIKDPSILQAVIRAYYRLIPDGRFPAAAVDIRINPHEVDANVHPAKLEVRFENPKDIFCLVSDAVAQSFKGQENVCSYEEIAKTYSADNSCILKAAVSESVADTAYDTTFNQPKPEYTFNLTDMETQDDSWRIPLIEPKAEKTTESVQSLPLPNNINEEKTAENRKAVNFKIVGQIADSFILCETDNKNIIFIDQHAAHERILFEKAQRKAKIEKMSIVLHVPINVSLTDEQMESIEENMEIIESYGYSADKLDNNTVKITRVPHSAIRSNIAKAFQKIISELYVNGQSKTEDAPRALLSCKSAIKAGDKLTNLEMNHLVELLFSTDNYGTCPHGRPIIYTMTISELARKFLR